MAYVKQIPGTNWYYYKRWTESEGGSLSRTDYECYTTSPPVVRHPRTKVENGGWICERVDLVDVEEVLRYSNTVPIIYERVPSYSASQL